MPEPFQAGLHEQCILELVQQRTGLYFRSVQRAHAATAIGRAMRRAGTSDPNDYVARLQRDLTVLEELVDELVVGETYFFRFPEQFRFLSEIILREFVAREDQKSVLRFWSAGCATGEEAYSLAIILREAGLLARSHILATDISRPALEHARQAIYQDWALRGEGRRRVEPHATCRNGFHQLVPAIRHAVHFSQVNLALDVYPSLATGTGHQDVIFCRNVLIYLDPAMIPRVASCLFESLVPGGWLITAASDPVLDQHAPFQTVEGPGGVYYRRPPREESAEQGMVSPACVDSQAEQPALGSVVELARQALADGQYDRAAALTADVTNQEEGACLHVKSLANVDTDLAQRACQSILARHPLSAELHYLHAVLLMEQRCDQQALTMIKRVLFLDRTHAIAHLTLGTLLRRCGDLAGAYRALRNARDLCRSEDAARRMPLTEDETFGSVHRAAISQLAALEIETEARQ